MNTVALPIIFKFLNMIAMIGLMAYIIKKYVMPTVYHSFKHEREALVKMQDSVEQLQHSYASLVDTVDKEEQVIARLSKSVEQWHNSMQEHIQLERDYDMARKVIMRKHYENKIHTRAQKEIERRNMCRALVQAENTLRQHFMHNDKDSKEYNEHIIKYVQKN